MKQGLTDITIILDRSGSMSGVREGTIGGYNAFLADQKAVPGEALLTLVQFDYEYQVDYCTTPIAEVPNLTFETYRPRGNTALLDAIGRTVVLVGERLTATPEENRPDKVLVVIMTDGQENSSCEFTRAQVFEMITHQRETYSWQFAFIGANQDAIASASQYGIAPGNAINYASTPKGTQSALRAMSQSVGSYRSAVAPDTDSFFGGAVMVGDASGDD